MQAAKDYLVSLLGNTAVQVQTLPSGLDVAEALIAAGHAKPYDGGAK